MGRGSAPRDVAKAMREIRAPTRPATRPVAGAMRACARDAQSRPNNTVKKGISRLASLLHFNYHSSLRASDGTPPLQSDRAETLADDLRREISHA